MPSSRVDGGALDEIPMLVILPLWKAASGLRCWLLMSLNLLVAWYHIMSLFLCIDFVLLVLWTLHSLARPASSSVFSLSPPLVSPPLPP